MARIDSKRLDLGAGELGAKVIGVAACANGEDRKRLAGDKGGLPSSLASNLALTLDLSGDADLTLRPKGGR